MSVDMRAGRGSSSDDRAGGQRTPRSGGRTAGQRHTSDRAVGARARRRDLPIDGTAALHPQTYEAQAYDAEPDRRVEVWNSTAQPDPAPEASAPRLRVAPPAPVLRPRAPFVALILTVVVGGVLGILLVNTRINENAFRLDRLQKEQTALDLRQQQLQKQIAEHEAPGNLAAAARNQGMVESESPGFIRLPDGKVIGVPESPGADGQAGAGG